MFPQSTLLDPVFWMLLGALPVLVFHGAAVWAVFLKAPTMARPKIAKIQQYRNNQREWHYPVMDISSTHHKQSKKSINTN